MISAIKNYFGKRRRVSPQPVLAAYNLWAKEYDDQPKNLMLKLDTELLNYFLPKLDPAGKLVLDIGCGTGRHWEKLYNHNPSRLTGFDVSIGMLKGLKEKFPEAECYQVQEGSILPFVESSVDIIFSTLTIAHMSSPYQVISEWSRILKPGGFVYISDFHPQILRMGGSRSFTVKGKSYIVENYIHEIQKLTGFFNEFNISLVEKKEILLTSSLREHYKSQDALSVYQKFYGMPLIYGIQLQKK